VTDDQTHYYLLLAANYTAVMQFGAVRVAALMHTTFFASALHSGQRHLGRRLRLSLWDKMSHEARMIAELRPPPNPVPT